MYIHFPNCIKFKNYFVNKFVTNLNNISNIKIIFKTIN